MRTEPYRIIIWGPGVMGAALMRQIATRPEFKIVGVLCYSPDKNGRDAGEIAGIGPIGVKATTDKESIYRLKADVALVAVKDSPDYTELDNDTIRLLESGKNVICSTTHMFPPMRGEAYAQRFLDACRKGNSSLHGCGENPSIMCERIALTATCFANRLKFLEVHEYADISALKNPTMVQAAGIGMQVEQFAQASKILEMVWGPLFASEIGFMGLKLHGAEPSRVKVEYSAHCDFATAPVALPDLFTVEKDQALCVHQTYKGLIDGSAFMSMNLHWYVGTEHSPLAGITTPIHHVIQIEAEPVSVRLTMQSQASFEENLVQRPGDPTLPVYYLGAMPMLQAIPRVCDAPPGFVFQDAASYWQPDFRSLSR